MLLLYRKTSFYFPAIAISPCFYFAFQIDRLLMPALNGLYTEDDEKNKWSTEKINRRVPIFCPFGPYFLLCIYVKKFGLAFKILCDCYLGKWAGRVFQMCTSVIF